jgi:4-diphosphocytidyl-2C-methyl-D-erythritol kinase
MPPSHEEGKTARMYASLGEADFSDGSGGQHFVKALSQGKGPDDDLICNAFQRAAYAHWPDLARYRDALLTGGARRVHLAGSGPALFAIARSYEEAQALAASVDGLPGAAIITRTLAAAATTCLES